MRTIEQLGVNKKWLKFKKNINRELAGWYDALYVAKVSQLLHYVNHGITIMRPTVPPSNASIKNWERYLDSDLFIYGYSGLRELEVKGVSDTNPYFDYEAAQRAYVAVYTSQLISLRDEYVFKARFGRVFRSLRIKAIPYTALGFIVGCVESASSLARLQLAAYRRGYFMNPGDDPLFFFMLRMLADYLNEPVPKLEGVLLKEPISQAMFELWRTPDVDTLTPVCLAACDLHTHRISENRDLFWNVLPIEILLLFKLRQLQGLPNPVIDHSLMNTPLGRLPDQMPCQIDPLVGRVRNRMMQDGYNEEEIFAEYLPNVPYSTLPKMPETGGNDIEIKGVSNAYSEIRFRNVSGNFGFVLNIPESWKDNSIEKIFQVVDPQTNTRLTASAYLNAKVTLKEWAESRRLVIERTMPYLRQVKAPYAMETVTKKAGIIAEYIGQFPTNNYESYYLVLCLWTKDKVISFTITAEKEVFEQNEEFYRWLIQNCLYL